jgi:signal peptidase I
MLIKLSLKNTLSSQMARKPFRFARLGLAGLALLAWAIWLRPESVGGQVDYVIVGGRSMLPTLHGGDLVMVKRQPVYKVGDIVAYHIPDGVFRGRRIIHRIVGGDSQQGFILRGDNNHDDDLWHPRPHNIDGKLWKRLPAAGRLVALARTPGILAAVVGGFVFAFAMTWERRSKDGGDQPDRAAIATTGLGDGPPPNEPANGQSEKSKTPPSEATRK